MHLPFLLALATLTLAAIPSPLICEDSINGKPPFQANDVPCILACVHPISRATNGLLPGSYNTTDIIFCQAQCVLPDITPDQLSDAETCHDACSMHHDTPEQFGWCLNLCLRGEKSVVATTSCIPWHEYGPPVTTVLGDMTVTVSFLTVPEAWRSWSMTQTILSAGNGVPGGQQTSASAVEAFSTAASYATSTFPTISGTSTKPQATSQETSLSTSSPTDAGTSSRTHVTAAADRNKAGDDDDEESGGMRMGLLGFGWLVTLAVLLGI